jgi:DNA sulfur modification protein DndB
MGNKGSQKTYHTSYAFNIGKGEIDCFVTVVKASIIFKTSKISRADEDPEKGFQRLLSIKRAKDIAEYLNEGNIIPGSLILSAQKKTDITFDPESKNLSFPIIENSFLVIDGQHRLYGAHEAEEDTELLVCIFNGLEQVTEVQYFLDVNSTQKGVPKTLRIELTKFLAEPNSKEEIKLKLFKKLNQDPLSPLAGRMSSTQSIPGKLTHVSFQKSLDPILDWSVMRNLTMDKKYQLLFNFLKAFENILIEIEGSSKRLSTATFFQAIFKNFTLVCDYSLVNDGNYKTETFLNVIEPLARLDFSKFAGSNIKTINNLADEIRSLIDISQSMKENEGLF